MTDDGRDRALRTFRLGAGLSCIPVASRPCEEMYEETFLRGATNAPVPLGDLRSSRNRLGQRRFRLLLGLQLPTDDRQAAAAGDHTADSAARTRDDHGRELLLQYDHQTVLHGDADNHDDADDYDSEHDYDSEYDYDSDYDSDHDGDDNERAVGEHDREFADHDVAVACDDDIASRHNDDHSCQARGGTGEETQAGRTPREGSPEDTSREGRGEDAPREGETTSEAAPEAEAPSWRRPSDVHALTCSRPKRVKPASKGENLTKRAMFAAILVAGLALAVSSAAMADGNHGETATTTNTNTTTNSNNPSSVQGATTQSNSSSASNSGSNTSVQANDVSQCSTAYSSLSLQLTGGNGAAGSNSSSATGANGGASTGAGTSSATGGASTATSSSSSGTPSNTASWGSNSSNSSSSSSSSAGNAKDGNAASGTSVSSEGGDGGVIAKNGNGGNGGDGGSAFIAKASISSGDTSSANVALISQKNSQSIVLVPIAVQKASADYDAFTHSLGW
jgi:hypothetical protein